MSFLSLWLKNTDSEPLRMYEIFFWRKNNKMQQNWTRYFLSWGNGLFSTASRERFFIFENIRNKWTTCEFCCCCKFMWKLKRQVLNQDESYSLRDKKTGKSDRKLNVKFFFWFNFILNLVEIQSNMSVHKKIFWEGSQRVKRMLEKK